MAEMFQPWLLLLYLYSVFFISIIPFSSCQDNLPQNIETFYPFDAPPAVPAPNPPISPQLTPTKSPQPPQLEAPSLPPPPPLSKSSSKKTVAKAVAATAASTLVVAGLFFFLLQKCIAARRRREKGGTGSLNGQPVVSHNEFSRFDGNLKGLIVDEDGLDVLYWRKLEGRNQKKSSRKEVLQISNNEEDEEEKMMTRRGQHKKPEPIQEIPLLRGRSSTSHNKVQPIDEDLNRIEAPSPPLPPLSVGSTLKAVEKPESSIQPSAPPPPPMPPPPPSLAIPKKKNPAPSPPSPISEKKSPAPPPPPPPKAGGLPLSLKPPPVPKGMPGNIEAGESSSGEGATGTTGSENGQVRLKPLHWDKVSTNAGHSMVWHKIDRGSFRVDDDLMEALFGYVATNRKSPQRSKPSSPKSGLSAQIIILDARKSQNTAIVLKSLVISRKEIIDALIEGQGLNADTLEKLTRIAPTKEEQSQILEFNGDPTRLADAESFLYYLLKAIPSAFTRFNAMLFRSNYESEILHLKESLQTLELGCKELRTRGLFMKLLEAILKAGNRMNAGTARGNAQAFNLTALRKLSDVKSTDGKTTLLHFVVEEVVRSEGKRCVINRNRNLSRTSSQSSNVNLSSENSTSKEEREKEYIMLGLPVVGGISAEFSNVKKAATIDYNTLATTCSALTTRAAEIQQLVSQCASDGGGGGGGGFAREMISFLEATEEELKVVREEQTRVMELVKRTTEYYHAGASKDKGAHLHQLFVIIKDFLGMVDQVCVEIARNQQRKKTVKASSGSSSPKSPASRSPVKFPILPSDFLSDKSNSSSSESDNHI